MQIKNCPIKPPLNPRYDEFKDKISEPIDETIEPLIHLSLNYYNTLLKNMKEESQVISFIRKINSDKKIRKKMPLLEPFEKPIN